jgi:hypothetical protein
VRLFRVGVAFVAALAAASAAVAAGPSLSVAPPSVVRGHVITLTGSAPGCRVGNTVTLISGAFVRTHVFAGVPAVYARAGRGGAFSVRTRIPAARAPGRYAVTARCGAATSAYSGTSPCDADERDLVAAWLPAITWATPGVAVRRPALDRQGDDRAWC